MTSLDLFELQNPGTDESELISAMIEAGDFDFVFLLDKFSPARVQWQFRMEFAKNLLTKLSDAPDDKNPIIEMARLLGTIGTPETLDQEIPKALLEETVETNLVAFCEIVRLNIVTDKNLVAVARGNRDLNRLLNAAAGVPFLKVVGREKFNQAGEHLFAFGKMRKQILANIDSWEGTTPSRRKIVRDVFGPYADVSKTVSRDLSRAALFDPEVNKFIEATKLVFEASVRNAEISLSLR